MTSQAPMLRGEQDTHYPLVVIVGPTASGKSTLALELAEHFGGEIVCCDAVTVYRHLDIGAAKPAAADRARVPHHCLDLVAPDQPTTAGDYARAARAACSEIKGRGKVPFLVGGAGLYVRATLQGLAPAPPRDEALRDRLRAFGQRRGFASVHRLLQRLDPMAAKAIHPNDLPKVIRSLEVTLLARRPQTQQWHGGRDALQGYRILQIALNPARSALYERINQRAAAMFAEGLIEETRAIIGRYGEDARSLGSLGYTQARSVLNGRISLAEAIDAARQGHRNYAKRQLTWFRREDGLHWLNGFGDDRQVQARAERLVGEHLNGDGRSAERESI